MFSMQKNEINKRKCTTQTATQEQFTYKFASLSSVLIATGQTESRTRHGPALDLKILALTVIRKVNVELKLRGLNLEYTDSCF